MVDVGERKITQGRSQGGSCSLSFRMRPCSGSWSQNIPKGNVFEAASPGGHPRSKKDFRLDSLLYPIQPTEIKIDSRRIPRESNLHFLSSQNPGSHRGRDGGAGLR